MINFDPDGPPADCASTLTFLLPKRQTFSRYDYIAEVERQIRPFPPRPTSTVAWYRNYWPHLDIFKMHRYSREEIERSRTEYEAEQKDKATYSSFTPFHKQTRERERL